MLTARRRESRRAFDQETPPALIHGCALYAISRRMRVQRHTVTPGDTSKTPCTTTTVFGVLGLALCELFSAYTRGADEAPYQHAQWASSLGHHPVARVTRLQS